MKAEAQEPQRKEVPMLTVYNTVKDNVHDYL
jgi:hypothetical protein